MKILFFITSILLITVPILNVDSAKSIDEDVSCIRLQDSPYGHVTSCSATQPLPLKV